MPPQIQHAPRRPDPRRSPLCAPRGECIRWIATQGYGFVTVPGETRSIFVHTHDIPMRDGLKALKLGEQVELSYHQLPDKRLRATAVFFPAPSPGGESDATLARPTGPQPAKRDSTDGQLSSGGLGKPLGLGVRVPVRSGHSPQLTNHF